MDWNLNASGLGPSGRLRLHHGENDQVTAIPNLDTKTLQKTWKLNSWEAKERTGVSLVPVSLKAYNAVWATCSMETLLHL